MTLGVGGGVGKDRRDGVVERGPPPLILRRGSARAARHRGGYPQGTELWEDGMEWRGWADRRSILRVRFRLRRVNGSPALGW